MLNLRKGSGIGPSNLLLEKLAALSSNWLNSGNPPVNRLFSKCSSLRLGAAIPSDSGTAPENWLEDKSSFSSEAMPAKAWYEISPENLLLARLTILIPRNRDTAGIGPARWLLAKLMALRSGRLASSSTSMAPAVRPIPSRCRPKTLEPRQTTPAQLRPLPPGHGRPPLPQLRSALVFLSCSLNRRRTLAAASEAAGEKKKRRMEKRAKMVEEAMHACMYYVRAMVELMIIVGHKYI